MDCGERNISACKGQADSCEGGRCECDENRHDVSEACSLPGSASADLLPPLLGFSQIKASIDLLSVVLFIGQVQTQDECSICEGRRGKCDEYRGDACEGKISHLHE